MAAWNYQTEVASDTPYLWYRMNESAGTTATDSGSNGEDGTYAGDATERVLDNPPIIWGANPGPQGVCPEFNTDGGAVDDGRIERASLTLGALDEIAAEIWIERADGAAINGEFLFCYAVAGTDREFALQAASATVLTLYVNGTSQAIGTASPVVLSDGRANHIYVDWRASDGRYRLAINGVFHVIATGLETGNNLTSGGTIMIGQDQSPEGTEGAAANAWEGRLDQFALYAAGLTEERIAVHASAGLIRYVPYTSFGLNDYEIFSPDIDTSGYINRVYDSVAGDFVRWGTPIPDTAGTFYPGPGSFGGDTSDYCIESVS